MDDDTRAAFADMRTDMLTAFAEARAETQAGFARVDRYFELSQTQHLTVRADIARLDDRVSGLDARVSGLDERVSGLDQRMSALEEELRSFRDWVTVQFAELRTAIQQLTARVARLESRQNDHIG